MHWIAPPEKGTATNALEKRLWEAADQLRTNSGLTATKVPFTFLYFATTRDDFVAFLANNATGAAYPAVSGATFDTIVVDTFRRMEAVRPLRAVVAGFAGQVSTMFEKANPLQRQIPNLHRTRDLLLARLQSGQVELATN